MLKIHLRNSYHAHRQRRMVLQKSILKKGISSQSLIIAIPSDRSPGSNFEPARLTTIFGPI
jgi:hypothetical protein